MEAYDHHLDIIDELKEDLKLCDYYGEEGPNVVITKEDSKKTAELKRRFKEEKEKYLKLKEEVIKEEKTLMDYHKEEMEEAGLSNN